MDADLLICENGLKLSFCFPTGDSPMNKKLNVATILAALLTPLAPAFAETPAEAVERMKNECISWEASSCASICESAAAGIKNPLQPMMMDIYLKNCSTSHEQAAAAHAKSVAASKKAPPPADPAFDKAIAEMQRLSDECKGFAKGASQTQCARRCEQYIQAAHEERKNGLKSNLSSNLEWCRKLHARAKAGG